MHESNVSTGVVDIFKFDLNYADTWVGSKFGSSTVKNTDNLGLI